MYQQLIDNVISARDHERQEERGSDSGEWHPSGLTGCARQAVYSYTGVPVSDQKDVRSIRIMDNGTRMHEEIQAALTAAVPGTLLEVKVDFGGVKGSCDALMPVGDGVEADADAGLKPLYELQEYKSISPNGKRFLKGEPKPEHAQQARIYHWALTGMGYMLDDVIRIVYMDRDDWSIKEYLIDPFTSEQAEAFEAFIAVLDNHVEEETLPERMPDDFWLCRYCDFRTICRGEA